MTVKEAQENIKKLHDELEKRFGAESSIGIVDIDFKPYLQALTIADSALNYLQVGQYLSKELESK